MARRPGLPRAVRKKKKPTIVSSAFGNTAAGARRGMPRAGKPGMGWSGKNAMLASKAAKRRRKKA
jgi:hypothetical protein